MAKVGQSKAYYLFKPKPVVRRLAYQVRKYFEEAHIACVEFSCGHKCKLQCLARKLFVLPIIVC
jgi:hypothetical protein